PTTAQHQNLQPKDRLSDVLSDSDISTLDLGPSLSSKNSSCYHLTSKNNNNNNPTLRPKDIPVFLRNEPEEEQKTRIAFSLAGLGRSEPVKVNGGLGITGGEREGDVTPKKRKGSVRERLRTISTPLLSPLRGSGRVGRPGVQRTKTSFSGVGGVLES
ncbi:hypothetical protein BBP40_012175, partial [Aspergillus hancockii]